MSDCRVRSAIPAGSAVLQIRFKDKASIDNVTHWREYSDEWWQIIRAFGLLTDTTTDQAKILSIEKASPAIVEILAQLSLVTAIGLAVEKVLNVAGKVLDLRKKLAEIKQFDLTNKQIELDLQKEADTFRQTKGEQIGEKVIAEINPAKSKDGETNNAIQISINHLFVFLEKGGTVDCKLPALPDKNPDRLRLEGLFKGIRQLETSIQEVKLITDRKQDDKRTEGEKPVDK